MAAGSPCPTCQKVGIFCSCINIGNIVTPIYKKSNCITINNKNNEKIFEIDADGDIFFKGKMVEDERELAIGFCLVISELTGISFSDGNKDEFIGRMIQYYRERQINKIL